MVFLVECVKCCFCEVFVDDVDDDVVLVGFVELVFEVFVVWIECYVSFLFLCNLFFVGWGGECDDVCVEVSCNVDGCEIDVVWGVGYEYGFVCCELCLIG